MEITINSDDAEETLDVTSVEHGTFRTTEKHTRSGKVPHIEGDTYTVIHGIQPGESDILREHNFVWLSGSLGGPSGQGKFPLVYIPEGHGVSVTVK